MSQNTTRHYTSEQYLLPADTVETARLNHQHAWITQAFENRLRIAPVSLNTGDKVLESAAGSGIWALEFEAENAANGCIIDVECVDITNKQFPHQHPPNVHFSVNSATDLPLDWVSSFSYAHQRLLIVAMNDSLWKKVVKELYRVLQPGGWIELLEVEAQELHFDVGPQSKKLVSLIKAMYGAKGIIGNLGTYLPSILTQAGFTQIGFEIRDVPIGQSLAEGNERKIFIRSKYWQNLWKAMKEPVLKGGGYGLVKTGEEYDELLQGCGGEWDNSDKAHTTYYAIFAQKPF
ncbi:hypothetical protein EV359DRAFT_85288 [Lentinula novae-zelandiae]|nr:hypothetical protein EV359DRAFT_85288 [Lentinula novae-zelandiae]